MSATITYKPQRGSIPADSLIALAKSENGRMASAVLLEAIGQPSGYAGLSSCLALCVENQLLEKTREGNLTFWSITSTGLSVAREFSAEESMTVPRRPLSALAAADAFLDQMPPVQRMTSRVTADADFALTANGRLFIEANGDTVILDQAQAGKLIEYIDAQRGVEWEAA